MEIIRSNNSNTTYHKALNVQQVAVLKWLYRFRFSTSKQIAEHLGRADHKAIQKKLQILEIRHFIGKRYDKTYKLSGRPAEYYLTAKGAQQIERVRPQSISPKVVKTLYKNKTVSQNFMSHCLRITSAALTLQATYGERLKIFTASQMATASYFPTWLPDLFLSLETSKGRQRYFLDIWDDTKPYFIAVRKTRNYLTYAEAGDWPTNDTALPAILAVCPDQKTQKRLNKQIKYALTDSSEDDTIFGTTTVQQLVEQDKPAQKIWLSVGWDGDPEKATLSSLFANQN